MDGHERLFDDRTPGVEEREPTASILSYTAGLRGEHEYEEELMRAGAPASRSAAESARARGQVAAAAGRELRYDTTAVAAQSQLARERSQLLRERAEKLRDRRAARSAK